jgi:cholesterol transport system auxiliary component
MKFIVKIVIYCIGALLLTSCLSPVKINEPATFVLNATPYGLPKRSYSRGTLMVMLPESTTIYNSKQMVYTIRPHEIAYYGKNEWAEVPAQMLQPLIVQTLQKTHYFHAIVTPPFVGRYDYVLSTQILKLQQNYTLYPAQYEMTIRVQLSSPISGRVIAVKEFTLSTPLSSCTPYGGVIAANQLTARFLRELAVFVGRSISH